MAGYNKFSMSNNAMAAYGCGEKPLSKWTKTNIFFEIKEQEVKLKCTIEKLKKLPVKVLKAECLCRSSWHHTSSYYNKTDFYALDINRIEGLTDERIDELIAGHKETEKMESAPVEEKWQCAFLEWSGSRNHPKATEVIEQGIVKGGWFYRSDGSKKKVTANGFRFIKQIQ